MLSGIVALRDALRALRGSGASRKGDGSAEARAALIELAALEDRLSGYAEDQREDDWSEFCLTGRDVATLRRHIVASCDGLRGLSPATLPALHALAEELAMIAPSGRDIDV
jgi:hypothetical protein